MSTRVWRSSLRRKKSLAMTEPTVPTYILRAREICAEDVAFRAATHWLERRRECDLRALEKAINRLRVAQRARKRAQE